MRSLELSEGEGGAGGPQTPWQHTQAIKMDPGYTYSLEILNEFFETVF